MNRTPIAFIDKYIPDTMAPVDCMETMLNLELGVGTFSETLTRRWAPLFSDETIRVCAKFWPSKELLAVLKGCKTAFAVVAPDGLLLANRGSHETPAMFQMDEKSLLLRYPWDLLRVQEETLAEITEHQLEGTVREYAVLDGKVILGTGSEILPGVYVEGVAVIGKNCKIGPNCYLRGFNYIGDNCHIGQAVEVKNSILMHDVKAGHLSYIGDSVICTGVNFGAGTICSNLRHDGKNHRSVVNGRLVDTGRRKFGMVVGKDVHTGIHTAIYPGRKIWGGISTRPGEVVQQDLRSAMEGE